MVRTFKVGGCVRDGFLGIKSKDIDYAVEASSFEEMREYIQSKGKIFLETPQYHTIRAMVDGEAADYVLCRKDGPYSDGRRPDYVEMGTIYDDLARRDFTINAMALTENGTLIDPHEGYKDLLDRYINCVGTAEDRISEDPLRGLRALRFKITKDFILAADIFDFISHRAFPLMLETVSVDRIREEITKMCMHDTHQTITVMNTYPRLFRYIFKERGIWLQPTTAERKVKNVSNT